MQTRIRATFAAEGFDVLAERHSGLSENFAFAEVSEPEIATMLRATAAARPDALVVVCTNMRATRLADRIEAETGVPVVDSIAAALLGGMTLAGADPARIEGWGRVFSGARTRRATG